MALLKRQRFAWLVTLVLVPFLVAAGFFTYLAVRALDNAVTLQSHDERAPSGPTRISGTLRSTGEPSASPAGSEAVAWSAWVATMRKRSKGRPTLVVLCARAHLAGLTIDRMGGEPIELALARDDGRVHVLDEPTLELWPDDGVVSTYFGAVEEAPADQMGRIPAAMQRICAAEIAAEPLGQLFYGEALVEAGAAVETFGCLDGSRLVPCGDGLDLVTTETIATHRSNARSGVGILALFGALWLLLVLSAFSTVVASRVLSSRRGAS